MKLHIFTLHLILAVLLVFVFPIYHAVSAEKIVSVDIIKFKFLPQEITIETGTTVRWTNKEKRQYIASGLKNSASLNQIICFLMIAMSVLSTAVALSPIAADHILR